MPPKKIFGIALAEAHKTHTTPQDFSSGEGIFAILRNRGFRVQALDEEEDTVGEGLIAPPTSVEIEDAVKDVPITPEERRWIEGNLKFALHLRRERSGLLPQQFKADFRARHGKLFCERCGEDHIDAYGAAVADACFDAHHTVPVAEMDEGHETTPDQLQLLCANCHRVTHREMACRGRRPQFKARDPVRPRQLEVLRRSARRSATVACGPTTPLGRRMGRHRVR